MDTSWCFLASYTAWLASIRVPTVAWFIDDWRKLNRLERSGRVCTAAYCKLPMTARSFCLSSSVTFVSIWDLLSLDMLIGSMFLIYLDWLMVMFPLGSCDKSIPVNVNWVDFFEPNGHFFFNSSIFLWNLWLPPQIPSSTWTPKIPSGWWYSFLKMKTHGSIGHISKPSLTSSSFNAVYQRNGASMSPYAPLVNWQTSWGFIFKASANSGTGSRPIILSPWGLPCKNAALMSNDWRFHCLDAISWRINIRVWRFNVGASLGTSVINGSKYPSTTSLALALCSRLVIGSMSLGSSGFHVRIQRHLKICSGDNLLLKILVTVLVFNQFWISLFFAFWNSSFSMGDNWESLTSLLCRRTAVAMNANSSGSSEDLQSWISWSVIKTSNLQASSDEGWRASWLDSGMSMHQSPSATSPSSSDGMCTLEGSALFPVPISSPTWSGYCSWSGWFENGGWNSALWCWWIWWFNGNLLNFGGNCHWRWIFWWWWLWTQINGLGYALIVDLSQMLSYFRSGLIIRVWELWTVLHRLIPVGHVLGHNGIVLMPWWSK